MSLSAEDHSDIARMTRLAAEAAVVLRAFEDRHGLDVTGPAMAALTQADVSLASFPRELALATKYLDDGKEAKAA